VTSLPWELADYVGPSFEQSPSDALEASVFAITPGEHPLHPSDKLVAQSLDAALECSIVLRVPLRTVLPGHSVSARERDVQHVVLIMA